MDFKSPKFNPEKERRIFSGVSIKNAKAVQAAAENTVANQVQNYNANIVLAIAKTNAVMIASAKMADDMGLVIPVPGPEDRDFTTASGAVRLALLSSYVTQSKNGTEIDFKLFKTVIDALNSRQSNSIDSFFDVSDEELANIDQFNVGALTQLAARGKSFSDFSNPQLNPDGSLKTESSDALIWMIMMQTCLTLLSQHEDLKWATSQKVEEENELTTQLVNAATLPPSKIAIAAERTLKIIIKVVKAVVVMALIYKLSKLNAKKLAQDTLTKAGIPMTPANQESIDRHFEEEFTKPTTDLGNLLTPQTDPNRLIFEYSMDYIEKNNGKAGANFAPWIIYASSIVRNNNLSTLPSLTPIDSDARGKAVVNNDYADKQQEIVRSAINSAKYTQDPKYDDKGKLRTWNNIEIPILTSDKILPESIARFLPEDLTTSKDRLHVDIYDYIEFGNQYAAETSATNDYFMSLMKNNKYTPELICCLINWLVNQNIGDTLDFLKGLKVAIRPIRFDYGRLFSDIVNGIVNQLKTRLMSFILKKLMTLVNRIRKWVAKQVDYLLNDNKFIIFCTPLLDILQAINEAILAFAQIMAELLKDLADSLLAFEVKWEDGFLQLQGVNRNRMLDDILDSLIYALQFGKLCKYQVQANGDKNPTTLFTPQSLEIVDRLSDLPTPVLDDSINEFTSRHKAVGDIVGPSSLVTPFKDPANPKLQGAVSIDRAYNNKSTMEVIVEYAGLCNSGLSSYNVGIRDLNT